MNIEITAKHENKLLKRTEYIVKVNHEATGTPKRNEIREAFAKKLGVPADQVVVRKIRTSFGVNFALVDIIYYWDKEAMLYVEPKYILKRNGILNE